MQQKNLPRDQNHYDVTYMLVNELCPCCLANSIAEKSFDCKNDRVKSQEHENRKHHDQGNVVIAPNETLVSNITGLADLLLLILVL